MVQEVSNVITNKTDFLCGGSVLPPTTPHELRSAEKQSRTLLRTYVFLLKTMHTKNGHREGSTSASHEE